MTRYTTYVLVLGFAEHNVKTIGPFVKKSDAELAKKAIQHVPVDHRDDYNTWGDGDTWLTIEKRKHITND